MMIILVNNKLKNIKFPKLIKNNDYYYIYGIKSIKVNNNTNMFILQCFKYDLNFNFIKEIPIEYKFEKSTLIWSINMVNNYYEFIIEQKSIDINNHTSEFYKYIIDNDIEKFIVKDIIKIELDNHLISTIYDDIIMASRIEKDEERPDYYWGKYLFTFYKDNKKYIPSFDKKVDYLKDKGHLVHYVEKINNNYIIIFSIRHKYNNKNEYYYKLYTAKSVDLINYYETEEIIINNNISQSNWYCYPCIFNDSNNYYVLMNQDDFGKNKESLLCNIIFS